MQTVTNVDLIVVGSLNLDITARVHSLPRAGETIGGGLLSQQPGGKGANQAAAAARLGARVRMMGAVGDDSSGRYLLDSLQEAGVDVSAVATSKFPTGTALITVDADGENQIAVCSGANDDVHVDADLLRAAGAVLLQLETPLPVVESAVAAAGGYLAINAAPAYSLSEAAIARADLVIVNDTEFHAQPSVRNARRLVVTHGGAGATLYHAGAPSFTVPATRATVASTVGAGDSFCAAVTIALAAGIDEYEALTTAAVVGAAAVEDEATQPRFESWNTYHERASWRTTTPL